jgi:hypothetical protein
MASSPAKIYIALGALCFVALQLTGLGHLPSLTSFLAGGQQFAPVGLCLIAHAAIVGRRPVCLTATLAAASVLPYVTLLVQGFMSFGTAAALVVLSFVANHIRPRWVMLAAGLAVSYVGLSMYLGYMRDRPSLRRVMWSDASLDDRLDILGQSLRNFEWFDPQNRSQCERIDVRLNQNYLVGAAVTRLEGTDYFANGETIKDGVLALVPRIIWPDKPIVAGSGTLVADYTGLRFAEGTSIGVGQLMELFINFGTTGVIIGFILIGALVTCCDWMAGDALARNSGTTFAVWLVLGSCLLNVIGSFAETLTTAAASMIFAAAIHRALRSVLRNSWHDASMPSPAWRIGEKTW